MSQPQTKISEVTKFLQQKRGIINRDDLRYARWLRDADSLIANGNAIDGYFLRGLVQFAFGYLEEAKYALKNAYQLSKFDAGLSYASALTHVGESKEAEKVILELLAKYPNNSDYLTVFNLNLVSSLSIENIDKAIDLFIPSGEAGEKLVMKTIELKQQVKGTLQSLEKVGISLTIYRHIVNMAQYILHSHYFGDTKLEIIIVDTEVGKFLQINQYLHEVDVDDCIMLNQQVENAIIEDDKFDFAEYQKIIYSFKPINDTSELMEA